MADTFTTITSFINSPPGQLAAGSVLGGIVWKFFKNVGDALNERTNREIAHWLRVKKFESAVVADEAANWPGTFAKVFDRVFGNKHLTWACFWRSCLASYAAVTLTLLMWHIKGGNPDLGVLFNVSAPSSPFGTVIAIHITLPFSRAILWYSFILNALPDYVSLLVTRRIIEAARRTVTAKKLVVFLIGDLYVTAVIAQFAVFVGSLLVIWNSWGQPNPPIYNLVRIYTKYQGLSSILVPQALPNSGTAFWYLPAFFTSIWLWLYAASGFLIKAFRRFDIGFDWFNRKFDIEKKPLQSMGLVAGALVAIICWTAALIRHFVS